YGTWFDDFVYLHATGVEIDELPVYRQQQQGADYFGIEAEASFPLTRLGGFRLVGDVQGDYVRATLADGDPVPRIPPLSLLGGLGGQSVSHDLGVKVQWIDSRSRVAPLETPTCSFVLVNLSAA